MAEQKNGTELRTRAFARVIGPFLTIVTAVVIYRMPQMGQILTDFFSNSSIVWISGAMLLFFGILIIAFHQYWKSLAAVLISLFGWFLALRGAILIVVPNLILSGGEAAMQHAPLVQLGFGVMTLIGLYLTYVGWIAKPRSEADKP
jgi:hypothetical protein